MPHVALLLTSGRMALGPLVGCRCRLISSASSIVRPQPRGDVVPDVFGFVLAEFGSGIEAVDTQTQASGALSVPPGACLGVEPVAALRLVALEVAGELAQDGVVLVLVRRTGVPYRCAVTWFPVGTRSPGAISRR